MAKGIGKLFGKDWTPSSILHFNKGGVVPNIGTGTGDTVPALLTPGERVVPTEESGSTVIAKEYDGKTPIFTQRGGGNNFASNVNHTFTSKPIEVVFRFEGPDYFNIQSMMNTSVFERELRNKLSKPDFVASMVNGWNASTNTRPDMGVPTQGGFSPANMASVIRT
jgi:hypothetical protein